MTSPVEGNTVRCPKCGHVYEDWHRASLNLELDDFDDEYIDQATSSTCPRCKHKINHDALVVRPDGIWEMRSRGN
jgi:NAD-dependent SIR2 family protein deacetylase